MSHETVSERLTVSGTVWYYYHIRTELVVHKNISLFEIQTIKMWWGIPNTTRVLQRHTETITVISRLCTHFDPEGLVRT